MLVLRLYIVPILTFSTMVFVGISISNDITNQISGYNPNIAAFCLSLIAFFLSLKDALTKTAEKARSS